MIITGFLVYLKTLSFPVAFIIMVIADLIGDSIYYLIGRYGKENFIRKYGKYIGINMEREQGVENYFAMHTLRTLLIGKFAHGVGSFVLAAAGLAKVQFRKLLAINIFSTAVKTMILMLIGYYYGSVYLRLNIYINLIGLVVLVSCIIIYVFFLKRKVLSSISKSDQQ